MTATPAPNLAPPKLTPQMRDFWAKLRQTVQGDVKTDPYSRILYSTDASIYQLEPLGVFFPAHPDEIQAAVEVAARYEVPVLMRGAGTALAGQTVNRALVIDTSRHLNQVIELNAAEKWVRVQPGMVLDDLDTFLAPHGLQFGPDPASSNRATMGGIVSNNATGSHSIVYGMTADHVLRASAILSDGSAVDLGPVARQDVAKWQKKKGLEGQLYRTLPDLLAQNQTAIEKAYDQHWRRCGGYNLDRLLAPDTFNLAQLLCGAEGTLAALRDVTLNLVDVPRFKGLGIIHFENPSHALEAIPALLETDPSAIEVMEELGLTMCREVMAYARLLTFIEGYPRAILITEYTGQSEAEVRDKLDKLDAFLKQNRIGYTCIRATDPAEQARVWKVRKVGLGLLMSVKGDYKPVPFIEDSAVPVKHLAEYVHRLENFCAELNVRMPYYAHASAGCVHIRPMVNLKEAEGVATMERISRAACEMVLEYGGAWSSEHGDGRARSYLNEFFFGPEVYGAFKQVKSLFDPQNVFNPGNVVEAGPMTENLRYGADYQVINLNEHLDFRADQGFHRAVEMCNGAGVCRKGVGTMCPSYMVTRDEEHSTRGRANLLRAALSGKLPPEEFTGQRMFEAMDLCIECKACKSECPSSVDMAKIKFEFLAHYYEANDVSLRTRLFGNIHHLSRLSSGPLAPVANWSLKNPILRQAMDKLIGISAERDLPKFAAQPFAVWFKRRPARSNPAPRGKVVLFADTFNNYNTPEVAIAATQVLEAAGYEVVLSNHGCCGRPMISKGLVNEARTLAEQTVARLAGFAEQGLPIIGLEPSCILSLQDEYFSLLPDNPAVKLVAEQTITFEEFIAQQMDDSSFELPLKPGRREVLLHGHCHQKALVGTDPAKKMLGLLGEVTEVDSGCCGMAGSFGYEAEHYEVSIAMAERRLLPAVRRADSTTLVVAAGVSCRHQIDHGSEREALHPAQALQACLAER